MFPGPARTYKIKKKFSVRPFFPSLFNIYLTYKMSVVALQQKSAALVDVALLYELMLSKHLSLFSGIVRRGRSNKVTGSY